MSRYDRVTGADTLPPEDPAIADVTSDISAGRLTFFDQPKFEVTKKFTVDASGKTETLPEPIEAHTLHVENPFAPMGEDIIQVDLTGSSFQKNEPPSMEFKPEKVAVSINGQDPTIVPNEGTIDVDFHAPLWQQRLQAATAVEIPQAIPEVVVAEVPKMNTPKVEPVINPEALKSLREKIVDSQEKILKHKENANKAVLSRRRAKKSNNPVLGTNKAVSETDERSRKAKSKVSKEEDRLNGLKKDFFANGGSEEDFDSLIQSVVAEAENKTKIQNQEKLQQEFGIQVVHCHEKIRRLQDELLAATDEGDIQRLQLEISKAEEESQLARNNFLDAGGLDIEGLIRDNSNDTVGDTPVLIEPGETAEEIASDIPLAMLASGALGAKELVDGGEELVLTESMIDGEQKPESKEALLERIAQARKDYTAADIHTMSLTKRLSQHFPWLLKEGAMEENKDLVLLRERYQGLLREYKTEKLEEVKNKEAEDQKSSLEALLVYFRYDEALKLEQEYMTQKKEGASLGGKLLQSYETLGVWYNGLDWKTKVAVGASIFAGSAALSVAGGIGISMGGIAIFGKRLLAGAGASVALDGVLEKYLENKKATEEKTKATAVIESLSESDRMDRMQRVLDEDIANLDQEFAKRRKKTVGRKLLSIAIGGGSGYALSYLLGGDGKDALQTEAKMTEYVENVSQDTLEPSGTITSDQVSFGPADAGGGDSSISGLMEGTQMPEAYTLSVDDSQKGLWGVIEKSLPSNLEGAEKTRVITSVENLIATKLEALSPEDRAAFGFRSGDINTIYTGDTLKLDGLVSQGEFQEILEGKEIQAPIEAVVSEVAATDTLAEAVASVEPLAQIEALDVSPEIGVQEVDSVVSDTSVSDQAIEQKTALETGGRSYTVQEMLQSQERDVYIEKVINLRQALFQTPETNNWLKYSYALNRELGRTSMEQISASADLIAENQGRFVENGLHQSQIERIGLFTKEAIRVYGDEAKPIKSETIESYTSRIAVLGFKPSADSINLNQIKRL